MKTGLDAISITDHNFLNSRSEINNLSKKYSIKIIYGTEFSCYDFERDRKVHVLCYNAENESVLEPICNEATQKRIEIGNKKAEFIKNKFKVPQSLINKHKSYSGCIYDQNLTHALLECGFCDSIYGEVYKSISSENLNITTKKDCDVEKVINLIHQAGGKAVIAHPGVYDSFSLLENLICRKLIDGIEVWHPKNSAQETKFLLNLVEENNLIATGGTDFHGFYSSTYFNKIGNFTTPGEYLIKLLN